jgi:hypothetical protein
MGGSHYWIEHLGSTPTACTFMISASEVASVAICLLLATRQRVGHRLDLVDRNRTLRPARTIDGGHPHGAGVLFSIYRAVAHNRTVHTHTRDRRTLGCMGNFTREAGIASANC